MQPNPDYYFPTRKCEACERGEDTITPPATGILRNVLPVHVESGMICAKYIPQGQWDALQRRKAEREGQSL